MGERKKLKKGGKMKREGKKKEGNYNYFVSLFIMGPYDSQKKTQKKEEFHKKLKGGKDCSGAHNIYPCGH